MKSSPSKPSHVPEAYLLDMFESAHAIQRYMDGVPFDEFWDDSVKRDAVVMRISVIGEASGRLLQFPSTVALLPSIPFPKLKGMRNLITHDYKGINYRTVWEVTQDHIPGLIASLGKYFDGNPPPAPVLAEIERIRNLSKPAKKRLPGR